MSAANVTLTHVEMPEGFVKRVTEHAAFLMEVQPGCVFSVSTVTKESSEAYLKSRLPATWADWVAENGNGLFGCVPTVENFGIVYIHFWFEHLNDAIHFKLNFFG